MKTKQTAEIPIRLGTSKSGDVTLDAHALVDTRLLVTANSGAGKSWVLRLIAEQASPRLQTFILDPEGEYATLRERVDAVLVGDAGELQPDPRVASKLARRLLETNVSAIVDLSELSLSDRRSFVRQFIEGMMGAPKQHWHPVLVLLDEVHRFCPERGSGEAESTDAVITLMSQGRKRGYCGILATQRLSKLHKDAAAEANNLLVGRTALDVDVARAQDLLGMSRADRGELRGLKPGTWYGFGPAFRHDGVAEFRAAETKTTHPRSGERHRIATPEPSARIRAVLAELRELPQAVQREQDELEGARRRIRELEKQVRSGPAKAPTVDVDAAVRRAVEQATQRQESERRRLAKRLQRIRNDVSEAAAALDSVCDEIGAAPVAEPAEVPAAAKVVRIQRPTAPANQEIGGGGQRRIMICLAQNPGGCTAARLGALTGLAHGSGTFSTYIGRLRGSGWIEGGRGGFRITDAGLDALGSYEPLPTGPALQDYWRERLGTGGIRRLLDVLLEQYPGGVSRTELAEAAGLTENSGTFSTYLGRLRTLELIEGRGELRASDVFFPRREAKRG